MANDPTASGPIPDQGKPAVPAGPGIDEELARLLPGLVRWARANLKTVGIADPNTAEDLVHRVIVKLKERQTYDPDKGPLGPYLRRAVWGEVREELRERARRPGNYGAAWADDDRLQQLEDSFFQSLSDLDTAWQRQRKGQTRQALQRIRERVKPMEYEVFFRKMLKRITALEVARQINEEFRPAEPLDVARTFRIAYQVQKVFNEEFHRAGIDPFGDGPDLSEICREFGIAKPSDRPAGASDS
jgi:DNA-directed RNA polymerase specialized sigma24 family protein